MSLTDAEINQLLDQLSGSKLDFIIASTVKRTVEELGLKPKRISRQEVIRRIKKSRMEKGIKLGKLTPLKNGDNNSLVEFDMVEFERFESLILISEAL